MRVTNVPRGGGGKNWDDFQSIFGVTRRGKGVEKIKKCSEVIFGCPLCLHTASFMVVKCN